MDYNKKIAINPITTDNKPKHQHTKDDLEEIRNFLKSPERAVHKSSSTIKVSKSQILLTMAEIDRRASKVEPAYSIKGIIFWKNAKESYDVLRNFEADTLRKYWTLIKGSADLATFCEIVTKNAQIINSSDIKYIFKKTWTTNSFNFAVSVR